MSDWLTVAELAQRLHVSRRFVYNQVRSGGARVWPCSRLGDQIRFTPANVSEIEALVAQPARGRRAS